MFQASQVQREPENDIQRNVEHVPGQTLQHCFVEAAFREQESHLITFSFSHWVVGKGVPSAFQLILA